MFIRKSKAVWEGALKGGKGVMEVGAGNITFNYSFLSRFGDEPGSNPEELIGAAHAGCFSMALALLLGTAGFKPERIETTARVGIDKEGDGFKIKTITLSTEADVPGISEDVFVQYAKQAKEGCPVSVALAGVPSIELEAKLVTRAA
jgi:peroxiredoxin, OsmC subfamily